MSDEISECPCRIHRANQPDVTRNLRDKAAKLREEAEFMDPLSGAYSQRLNEATQLECEADLMETVYPADVTRSDVDSLSAEREPDVAYRIADEIYKANQEIEKMYGHEINRATMAVIIRRELSKEKVTP